MPDGLWKLYNEPMAAEERRHPALVEVGDAVDVLQARFDPASRRLRFALRRCAGARGGLEVVIGRLAEHGRWTLALDGREVAAGSGRAVSRSTLPALRTSERGLLLDCGGLAEAGRFVLSFDAQ